MHTIENAPIRLLQYYAIYVAGKIDVNEIPLDFEQWQENTGTALLEEFRKKKKFSVCLTWEMSAIVEIEAEAEAEALLKAGQMELPEGTIVEDSFDAMID